MKIFASADAPIFVLRLHPHVSAPVGASTLFSPPCKGRIEPDSPSHTSSSVVLGRSTRELSLGISSVSSAQLFATAVSKLTGRRFYPILPTASDGISLSGAPFLLRTTILRVNVVHLLLSGDNQATETSCLPCAAERANTLPSLPRRWGSGRPSSTKHGAMRGQPARPLHLQGLYPANWCGP